jgi:hypothetical protein
LGSSAKRQIQPLRPKRSHKVGPEESGNELADNEVGMDLAIHQVASHGYAMDMPWICHGYEDNPRLSKYKMAMTMDVRVDRFEICLNLN